MEIRHIFAVETAGELERYRSFALGSRRAIDEYIAVLRAEYEVRELPRAIVWTSCETATRLLSGIPIPAYTNDYRVVLTPDIGAWREIYLKQLERAEPRGEEEAEALGWLSDYYRSRLNGRHVLKILGHELAHHSELFLETDGSGGIWFEEGMVEYISRRHLLTDEEFGLEARCSRLLVHLLGGRYGGRSLEDFGAGTYGGEVEGIFFEYWRSFLAVERLVREHGGSAGAVLRSYRQWHERGRGQTLAEWFGLE